MNEKQIDLLRNMPAFGGLKPSIIEWICFQSRTVTMPQDQYFFREGDPGDSLFVIERGIAKVTRDSEGQAIELGSLKEGDCFGEMALIDFRKRSASVIAATECQVIEVPRQTLGSLYSMDLEQYAIIMMNLGREVSRRLRITDQCLFELRQLQNTPTT